MPSKICNSYWKINIRKKQHDINFTNYKKSNAARAEHVPKYLLPKDEHSIPSYTRKSLSTESYYDIFSDNKNSITPQYFVSFFLFWL